MRSWMRISLVAAVLVLCALPARAELVYFANGRTMSIKSHRLDGDSLVLVMRAGGEITCEPAMIARIAPDEVPYPEDAPPTPPVAAAPATGLVPYSEIIDKVFASLPAKGELSPVAAAEPQGLGRRIAINLDVPQSVVMIGGAGIPRKDPDFIAAFIVNHILGGGSFSSRLYREVREVRGLAYSVYSSLVPLSHASLFMGSTATRADRTTQTLDVVEKEIHRLAETGPTEDELVKAKSFLKGSFALRFDTSTKIAAQLVQIQLEDLGIDYIDKRNGLIEAITLGDVKRVAKRLLDGGMLVTVVGRPQQEGLAAKSDGG